MASNDGEYAGVLYKQRQGTCHRCGWKGTVSKVGRSDRKRLQTGRQYGRLCPDCASELVQAKHSGGTAAQAPPSNVRAIRDSDVA
jgi:hypothetical protein